MNLVKQLALLVACCGIIALSAIPAMAQEPVGEWALESNAQGQITPFTLTITKENNVLKGKITSEQYGSQNLTDLKFANGELTYTRNLEIGGQAVTMNFKGKIEGDKLTGAYVVQGFELPVTGNRKSADGKAAPK